MTLMTIMTQDSFSVENMKWEGSLQNSLMIAVCVAALVTVD